jgi:hypothetical protein
MVAPVATVRTTPTAKKMDDGFKSLIAIASNPAIEFWEETVTPPGLDGGDAIDTMTMHSTRWRTKAPRKLITMGDVKATVEWNPSLYTSILALSTRRIRSPSSSPMAPRWPSMPSFASSSLGTCQKETSRQPPLLSLQRTPILSPERKRLLSIRHPLSVEGLP